MIDIYQQHSFDEWLTIIKNHANPVILLFLEETQQLEDYVSRCYGNRYRMDKMAAIRNLDGRIEMKYFPNVIQIDTYPCLPISFPASVLYDVPELDNMFKEWYNTRWGCI